MTSNLLFLMFFALMLALIFQKTHILNYLLILEIILLLITFFSMFILSNLSMMNSFMLIIILSFAVCEASVALACLVSMSRHKTGMMMPMISLFKC